METPIISPWIFYFGDLFTHLQVIFVLGAFTCLFIGVFKVSVDSLDGTVFTKATKWLFTFSLICFFLFVITPSEETYYKMVTAHYVTYEKVDKLKELSKEGFEYILDKIVETSIKARKGEN